MTFTRIALIASLFALTASTAFAGIVRVGPNRTYTTIQDGVDNASEGDTILIDKGVYVEEVDVTKKSLTIRPAKKGKKGKVTISGQISFFETNADDCTVRDLTVVNSVFSGIAVELTNGVRIIGCTVSGGASLAGILITSSNSTLVHKCKVLNVSGVGIKVDRSFQTVISKCKVKDGGLEGIDVFGDGVTVTNNEIVRPGLNAIELGDPGTMKSCQGSLISGNKIEDGFEDGIYVSSYASHCTIEDNVMRGGYALVYLAGAENQLVMGNKAIDSKTDAFYSSSAAWAQLYKNVVKDCGSDGYDISNSCDHIDLVKNKSRGAGDNGFEVRGSNHTIVHNDSRKSNRVSGTGLDIEAATATNLMYMGNIYDTTDL